MPGWWAPDDDNDLRTEPPPIEVEDTPNEVVGELLGPDGEPIVWLLERAVVPMGFRPEPKTPSRVVRGEGW
jgi:hypothetical protein